MNETDVEAMPFVGIAYWLCAEVTRKCAIISHHKPLESFDLLTLHCSVFVVR